MKETLRCVCLFLCVLVFVLLIRLSKLLSRWGNVIKDAVLTIIDYRCRLQTVIQQEAENDTKKNEGGENEK